MTGMHCQTTAYYRALPTALRLAGAVTCLGLLAACGVKPAPEGISDPNEKVNREIHDFNRGLDKGVLRPASKAYAAVLPDPVERGISNAAQNLGEPANVINSVLQARPANAGKSTLRFAVNSTVGVLGLFDPATALGLPKRDTDFGETLHVWGASEGNYVEVPALGPKTERDLAGAVVDFAMSPWRYVLPTAEANAVTAIAVGSKLGDRAKYSDTIDSVLYESADSYAQSRLIYLQNRRYQLGQTAADADGDAFVDPYEDANGY